MTLDVRSLTKRYGELSALRDVSVQFRAGEVHAVLGENGAGKSTLVGVLAGFVQPTMGEVSLDGEIIPYGRAFACRRRGIEMVHQHFTLVSQFTVAENFALARLPGLASPARVSDRARPSIEAAARLGWPIDPQARVGGLAVGERQRVEILKALGGEARVLLLDEPTAVLSAHETEDLFRVLRRLRDEGRIVILIAHKLREVLAVADRITVLRRGEWVATVARADAEEARLAEWMVGELPASSASSIRDHTPEVGLKVADLVVTGDRGEASVRGVSFDAARGEIVGIGGVDGNGQIELAEALAGVRPVASGRREWPASDDFSVGYIPQDRHTDGLALGMTVRDNLLAGALGRPGLRRGPFLRRGAIDRWADGVIRRFDIRGSGDDRAERLSGGNQQKIVVGRTLDGQPDLLVAVNPTRGLDFRATEFVHARIRDARDAGAAVVLFSTDVDELFALSDKRWFMSAGRLMAGDSAAAYLGSGGTA